MLSVTEINRIEDLESLRLTWNALLARTRGASFFHSLDWLQAYWQHFGEDQYLRVLVVSHRHKPVGILPLTVIREQTRVGLVRVLTYPLHDWASFFGPIGPNPTVTLTLAMQYIRDTERNWDLLDMRWINLDEHDHLRTKWSMEHAGFSVRESAWKMTSVIDMDGDWESYWKSRNGKFRQGVTRRERRAKRGGNLEFVRYRPAGTAYGQDNPRWDLFYQCTDIACQSWQGSSTTGTTLSHSRVHDFFHDTHILAVKNGMLDLNMVVLENRPVAFSYNYHCRGRVFGLRRGFLPEVAQEGIGNTLNYYMFRDSFERGDEVFDMGTGYPESKRKWATRLATSYRYTFYSRLAPRAQLLRVKHWSVDRSLRQSEKSATA
jgi:CelD/BcsL family acetyltransferase involved in cellulose biosynthesis